jgi:hypothetical protein
MDTSVLLWLAGGFLSLLTASISFNLKYVVDTLKELSDEIHATTKESQGRFNILEIRLVELETKHDSIHCK